jgi:AraC-like DNA-binding protein
MTRDDVSGILHSLRLAHTSYCRSEVTRPWGLDLPCEAGRFHYVAEGGCLMTTATDSVWLGAGDVVLMVNIGPGMYRLRAGGGGTKSVIVCCKVAFEEPCPSALIAMMPPLLIVRGHEPSGQAVQSVLQLMAGEAALNRHGAATVMTRLADVAITHLLREWIEGDTAVPSERASALADPHIGPALAAIHRDPGRAWSVGALASLVHVSRSSFAQRFTALMEVPPARYVALWRMRIAERWLSQDRISVAQVAMRLGYESEASFARAFKRITGHSPGHCRRVHANAK